MNGGAQPSAAAESEGTASSLPRAGPHADRRHPPPQGPSEAQQGDLRTETQAQNVPAFGEWLHLTAARVLAGGALRWRSSTYGAGQTCSTHVPSPTQLLFRPHQQTEWESLATGVERWNHVRQHWTRHGAHRIDTQQAADATPR